MNFISKCDFGSQRAIHRIKMLNSFAKLVLKKQARPLFILDFKTPSMTMTFKKPGMRGISDLNDVSTF